MSREPGRMLDRPRRFLPALAVFALVLLSSGVYAGAAGSSTAPAPVLHATPAPSSIGSVAPAGATSTAPFYHITPNIAAQSNANVYCALNTTSAPSTSTRYCFPQAQNPSTMRLANGNIAVAYSILTQNTSSTCPAATNTTNSRVGFSQSTDGGMTFGAITYLGNDTCPYVSAIEPTFAVSSTGTIYGVFVEENFSNASNAYDPGLPPDYGNRSTDALGFVVSTDNGTTFSMVRTILSTGNIARPQLSTSGDTVYVVYTNIANGTTPLGLAPGILRPSPLPESVELIASTDGGTTWGTPVTLPGENASEAYTSFGASIAVNTVGMVAVAYATNRSCLAYGATCSSPYFWLYGENVVVATSTTNGSTWSAPHAVGPAVAEAGCYGYDNGTPSSYFYPDPCLVYLFELTPQTSITFGASDHTIYVAYSGGHAYYYSYEENSNVYTAASTDSGVLWNSTDVADPLLNDTFTTEEYSTPGIAYSNGTVYLSYLEKNGTECFISNYCSLLLGSYIEWATTSTNGLLWAEPTFLTLQSSSEYTPRWIQSFSGYTSSIAFNSAGHPVIAFALDEHPESATAVVGNVTELEFEFGTQLDVAVGSAGTTSTLTFRIVGDPGRRSWNFSVDGRNFTGATGTTAFNVTGVPTGPLVKIDGPSPSSTGYARELAYVVSVPELSAFSGNATVYFNATNEFGLSFTYEPPQFPDFCMCLTLDGAYYIYIPLSATSYIAEPSFPWFFPAGARLLVAPQINQGSDPTLYYVGTGNGSHTGPGTWANLTMNGPVNETVWNGLLGNSSLNVTTSGLPAGTAFSFDVGNTSYAGLAGTPVYVSDLTVGPHSVANAQALGTGGFEWFGSASAPDPVVPYETSVTLTFADVNLSSALGTVSFEAVGVLPGSDWTLSFNGSLYASSTPWINVTSRSGTFPFATFSAVTVGGEAGYVPTTHGPTIRVDSGATVDVNFTAAYQVRVASGVGGSVTSPLTQFVAPGSTVALNATAHAGYIFAGWSGLGNGSYTGPLARTNVTVVGTISESALFSALPTARFNLTFTQSGVPAGTWWSVSLDGVNYATNQSTLRVGNLSSCSAGASGLYAVAVPFTTDGSTAGVRYVPNTVNGTVCTTGATVVPLSFTAQYLVTTTANIAGPSVTASCGLSTASAVWCGSASSVTLAAPAAAGYEFAGWQGTGTGSYTGASSSGSFLSNGPVTEVAQYLPSAAPPTYSLTLSANPGLASGTEWSVTVAGVSYSSTSETLAISGLSNGSLTVSPAVAVSPGGGTRYTPVNASIPVVVAGDTPATVHFSLAYLGTISGGAGGTVGPASGWFAANSTVTLSAIPSLGDTFVGWASTGGAYSGNNPNGTFSATGPFSEVATFAPVVSTVTTTTPSNSIWSSPGLWIGVGIVGLIVGVAAGVLLSRRGRTGPGSSRNGSGESDPPSEPEVGTDGSGGSA